ncbi:MAG: hypothetical protein ACOC41_03910 [Chitinivibrionales bacterium]
MNRSIREVINLTHTEFGLFASEFLYTLSTQDCHSSDSQTQDIEQELQDFESMITLLTGCEAGVKIDRMEARRYRVWENIMDVFDDNIGVSNEPCDFNPKDLLSDKAYHLQIPEYTATCKLLYSKGARSRHFPMRGGNHGHFWSDKDMCELISRLLNPKHKGLCKAAGVDITVELLRKVEEKIATYLNTLPPTCNLAAIRQSRYRICSAMIPLLKLPHGLQQNVPFVRQDICLHERSLASNAHRKPDLCSLDHLTPVGFLRAVDSVKTRLCDADDEDNATKRLFTDKLREISTILDRFSHHPLWEHFDMREGEFYRSCFSLLERISAYAYNHSPAAGHGNQELETTRCFTAASILLDMLDINHTVPDASRQPNLAFGFPPIKTLLENWSSSGSREFLEICHAGRLFDHCVLLYKTTAMLAERMLGESPPETLFRMRTLRHELSRISMTADEWH